MTDACNSECMCEDVPFSPVCSHDEVQYFSACHAGCVDYIETDSTVRYIDGLFLSYVCCPLKIFSLALSSVSNYIFLPCGELDPQSKKFSKYMYNCYIYNIYWLLIVTKSNKWLIVIICPLSTVYWQYLQPL